MSGQSRRSLSSNLAVLALLAVIALALGLALHSLAVDDAYITYRFARNLAEGNGFVYNLGRPILSTTAPLYALLLAAGAVICPNLPVLANGLSSLALWAAAALLFVQARGEGDPWAGALAALLLIGYPLLWLSLGLETAVFLALGLAAIVTYQRGRLFAAAALLALSALTRGDGLILAAVMAADYALPLVYSLFRRRNRRRPQGADEQAAGAAVARGRTWGRGVRAAGVFFLVLLPAVVWLSWRFGSPVPVTLRAKVAQSELGVTGFYAHTTYLQGLWLLIRARFAQSPLYLLFAPACLLGLVAVARRASGVRLIVGWSGAHLVAYTLLGVTPYYWYYAPLVPGLVTAAAVGIVKTTRWLGSRGSSGQIAAWGLGGLWALALTVSLARSDWAMVRALEGPVPPPEDPVSKVLPEAKVGPYLQAGEWLHEHAAEDAVVGVTEVGIIGYHARRMMVDFLGLLEPEVAKALTRGDLYWALLRYQPDYLALTAVSPLYAYDLRADPWFQSAYKPVQAIDDPRFWGTPVTIYQRAVERVPLVESTAGDLPEDAIRLEVDLGPIRLLGAVANQTEVQPGDVLALTLYWQALPQDVGHAPDASSRKREDALEIDYTVFVHLLGQYDRVLAQRDAPPGLGSLPTSQWEPGQVVADPYLLALPETAYTPDEAVWEVGLYNAETGQRLANPDGTDNVRFGFVSVQPPDGPLDINFGVAALTGYELDRLALTSGDTLEVTLRCESTAPAVLTLQLVDEAGAVAGQVSGGVDQELYRVGLAPDAAPGAYDLEIMVADPATGQTLPLLGTDGQPRGNRAYLTKVRLYP